MRKLLARITTSCLLALLASCGGSGSNNAGSTSNLATTPSATTLSGSVGDGPVVNATLKIFDGNGIEIAEVISDNLAKYELDVPANTTLPITIRATGGIDLVTGRELDFELVSFVNDPGQTNVNISPITTLEYHAASCLNGASSIAAAKKSVTENASMGLEESDSQFDYVGPENIAAVVKANEALGEVIRRVANDMPGTDAQSVVEQFGCDLADGSIDGSGSSSSQTAALLHANIATVSIENMANELNVDGSDAVSRMDDAIATVEPAATTMTSDIEPSASAIEQLQASLSILNRTINDDSITEVQALLASTPAESLTAALNTDLNSQGVGAVKQLPVRIVQASVDDTNEISRTASEASTIDAPMLSFTADSNSIESGDTVTLSWASTNSDQCFTAGDWASEIETSGSQETSALVANSQFGVTCIGLGGTVADSTTVIVNNVSSVLPAATVVISASSTTINSGDLVELQWSSTNASSCVANGGWSGIRPTSGSQTVYNLDNTQSFSINCVGESSQASDTVTVDVREDYVAPAPTTPTPTTPTPAAPVPAAPAPETPSPTTPAPETPAPEAPAPEAPAPETPAPEAPAPQTPAPGDITAQLNAAASWIPSSGTTQLTWSSSNATGCEASGAWSGNKALSGSESVGPLTEDRSFTLTCTNGSENAVAITTVAIRQARISWNVPTQNTDGSGLNGLTGYRLYWGTESGKYTESVDIDNPNQTSHVLALNPSSYYFTLSAFGADGVEGPYSSELSKTIR